MQVFVITETLGMGSEPNESTHESNQDDWGWQWHKK